MYNHQNKPVEGHIVGPSWETIAGWVAGVLGFVSTLFVTAVYYWTQDRFDTVDEKLDKQCKDIESNRGKTIEHDVKLGEIGVHIQHTNGHLAEIKDTLRELKRANGH